MSKLNQQQLELSKTISYFLRHNPHQLGVELDLEGWTNIDQFLSKLSKQFKKEVSVADIEQILNNSDKKRWEIDLENNSIRALYGHSVKDLEISYPFLEKAITLYHGTPEANKDLILEKGLLSMSRQFVHLTQDKDLAIKTAQRISKNVVLIKLDVAKMLVDGVKIYQASDSIYLTELVLPEYLSFEEN